MIRARTQPHRFPVGKTMVCLSVTAIACLAGGLWLFGSLYGHESTVQRTVGLAVGSVWGASIVAVLPLTLLGPRGVLPTVCGYFIGMGVRLSVCIGVFVWVKVAGRLPPEPMALALGLAYLPLLGTEMILVGKYLWAKDFYPYGPSVEPMSLASSVGGYE